MPSALTRLSALAREDGWLLLLLRLSKGVFRRIRDHAVARKLAAPNFRCGRSPRLLGLAHMRVGRNFAAGDHLWLEAVTEYAGRALSPLLTIGDNVGASDNVHIACAHSVTIGSGTLFGSRVVVTDHEHGLYRGPSQSSPGSIPAQRPLSAAGTVVIGANVWLGDGVAVLNGARIGDGCIVGANSVVTGEIPAHTIAAGAPARPLRRWHDGRREWIAIDSQP